MLSGILEPMREKYDYILIDTCPSLGTLTINALAAADDVIITVNPQLLAMMGMQDFLKTVMKIKRRINPKLEIAGILLTMCDTRTKLCKVLTEQVADSFHGQIRIFGTRIPNTVKVGESIYYSMPVGQYSLCLLYTSFKRDEIQMLPIMGMENPWRYRNKAQFPFGRNKDGEIIAGFYAGRTHDIIGNDDCLLGVEENQEILGIIKGFMEENGLEPYDEYAHKGLVRHVLIRKGFKTGELMVCLVINGRSLGKKAGDRRKDRWEDCMEGGLEDCREERLSLIHISFSSRSSRSLMFTRERRIPIWT